MASSAANLAKIEAWAGKKGATFAPSPRTSHRWIGRTKGLPFSRFSLVKTDPSPHPGVPATLHIVNKANGHRVKKRATLDLLRVMFPSLPSELLMGMLGIPHRRNA